MEYLMTYGWAIIVLLAVFSALIYVVYLNIKPVELCSFPPGIYCSSYRLASNGVLTLKLKNGLGAAITITKAKCTSAPFNASDLASYDDVPDLRILRGFEGTLELTCYSGSSVARGEVGQQFVGKVYLLYSYKGQNLATKGELIARYQPA